MLTVFRSLVQILTWYFTIPISAVLWLLLSSQHGATETVFIWSISPLIAQLIYMICSTIWVWRIFNKHVRCFGVEMTEHIIAINKSAGAWHLMETLINNIEQHKKIVMFVAKATNMKTKKVEKELRRMADNYMNSDDKQQ